LGKSFSDFLFVRVAHRRGQAGSAQTDDAEQVLLKKPRRAEYSVITGVLRVVDSSNITTEEPTQ
jgi:hypothetical protein